MFLSALALAGCGGDAMSEKEFRAEGKRICEESADRTERIVRDELAKPDVAKMDPQDQQVHIFKVAEKNVEDTMSKLEALDAPEDAKPHVEKMTKGVREVMDVAKDAKNASSEDITRLAELAAETRKAAEKAGLQACLPENTTG